MKIYRSLAGILALSSLSAPAFADVQTAAFVSASDRPVTQTSMFVGTTVSFGLTGKSIRPRYRASLGFGGMAHNPATSEFRLSPGLELALTGKKKPALYMAGSDVGQMWKAAKLSGGGKTALIIGGVAVALGVAALVVVDKVEDERDSD